MKTHNLVLRVFRALIAALLALVVTDAMAAGYFVRDGKIFDPNGQEIRLRGINHFGFNTDILRPQYLWKQGWKTQIADIKQLGFNAVRVPFTPDTLYDPRLLGDASFGTWMLDQDVPGSENSELLGLTSFQALKKWTEEADRQGLYILLDFHSVTAHNQYGLWFMSDPATYQQWIYDGTEYTETRWINDLVRVASEFSYLPHFIGIDLFNEPHDEASAAATWNGGGPGSWRPAAESAAAAVLAANPNLLIFVQGIDDDNGVSNIPYANWGENLQPASADPLAIPNDKLVLSPHTYGPDEHMKPSFSSPDFPNNLAADWDTLFGQLRNAHPLAIGEFGGQYGTGSSGDLDRQWQEAFTTYLVSHGICSSFYWAYTPNSERVGGIYFDAADGTLTRRYDKMDLLMRYWLACGSGSAPGDSLTVFDDAVTPAWQLSPWSATADIQNQFAKSGTAVRVDAQTWGGFSFDSRDVNWVWTDQPTNRYTTLSFDVSAGPTVGATISALEVSLDLGWGTSKRVSDHVPSFAPNTWYHVEVPIAAMNPQGAATFQKIVFQNNSESNLTFYIDNVALTNGGTTEPPPTPQPLQSCAGIMPLGDSITAALGLNGGYRRGVYVGLQQNNCGVDFVGTQQDADGSSDFDPDHEGHPGASISAIAGEVNGWLATTAPNIILLMIGTNDTAWTNDNGAGIADHHNALIDQLFHQLQAIGRQDAWIFVATIPPTTSQLVHGEGDDDGEASVDRAVLTHDFNNAVRTNVQSRVAAGQHVRLVNVEAALTVADLSDDGIHPTSSGQDKIATQFLQAIRATLASQ